MSLEVKPTGTELLGEEITITKETKIVAKKGKKESKQRVDGISKNTIGLLRTTLRNNTELTNIADNKANVLLSLNAIMLTFFVPLLLPNIDLVSQYNLGIPLIIFVGTSLITIYIAVLVLRPGKFGGQTVNIEQGSNLSPFFFGNFEKMSKSDYLQHFNDVLGNDRKVKKFLSNDFYHLGLRLGEKMKLVRRAFNIFIVGLVTSILLSTLLIFIEQWST